MKQSSFSGVGGLKIATREWKTEHEPRAVMILIHGFNSHSGYMEWPAEELLKMGIASYALDMRGRGLSEGERFFVEKFDDYVNDVGTLVDIARAEYPDVPVYMLGHSAGGIVGATYIFDHPENVAGFVCESFAFDVGVPHLAQLAFEGVSHLIPHVHLLTLKNADFSRDPAEVERMNNDPLIKDESQPAETGAELLKAASRLKDNMPNFMTPVLILHGTGDKAARYQGSQYFYDHAGSTDKSLKLYDGHFHDLLNDTGKQEVMSDIEAWLAERIPAETSRSSIA